MKFTFRAVLAVWIIIFAFVIGLLLNSTGEPDTYSATGGAYDPYYDATKDLAKLGVEVLTFPVPGYQIGSPFGWRLHPIDHIYKMHNGVDIGAPAMTNIVAAASGTVTISGPTGDYGNMIEIDHGNGIKTRYGHISNGALYVKKGDKVTAGQVIAGVGSTGKSTTPHCHFEVRLNGKPVNPKAFVIPGGMYAQNSN